MGSLTQQPKLPVIEFSEENTKRGTRSWLATQRQVVDALEEYGCFEATYDHNYSLNLHNAIFEAAKQLFFLPLQTKILNTSKVPSHGYVGGEPIIPLYEGLGIENATTLQGAHNFTKLMWPSGNDFFCETTVLFARIVAELDQVVMRMVSESYGIERDYEELVEATSYLLRLIKYRERETDEETNLGIVPHTDKSFMSILHQHQGKGLEIEMPNHDWLPIHPSPSTFLVLAGDACQGWTNGKIKAPRHRVIMKGREERYSLGVFTFIRDVMINTPQALVDEQHPLQYQAFDHFKFIDYYYTDEGKRAQSAIKSYCGV